MKLDLDTKKLGKHGLVIGIFLIIPLVLFHPAILSDKTIERHDSQQWRSAAQAIIDFRDKAAEEPLWTNSMFSGMPTTLISTIYNGDLIGPVKRTMFFLYGSYTVILISCICFYILLQTYKIDPLVAAIGSICYSCSSYIIIGYVAGHNSRVIAIAYLPLVVAGFNLIFNKKYRSGFIATAIGLAIEIEANHLQITYYLALILVVLSIQQLVITIKEKDTTAYSRKIPILLAAVVVAIGANFGKLWDIVDYGKYSTRGKSELASQGSGLNKDYIFEFSNSITEPLVLFIPNFYGGASQEELSLKSNVAEALRSNGVSRNQVKDYVRAMPTYWGEQRLTAPYYVGAIAVFLAVLGIIILDRRIKVWLIIVTILGIVLSWGDHFESFNYFLFNYLPGYNKFRSVTFAILIAIFGISVLASLGLQKILTSEKNLIKPLLTASAVTGGFALLAAIFAEIGGYSAPVDEALLAQQWPQWLIDALREDRADLLRKDALRTVFYVASAKVIIFLILKKKISKQIGVLAVVTLTLLDMILIDKRYLNSSDFVKKQEVNFIKSEADEFILNQSTSGERILNLLNPFNDATPSYYHESIGGYHGAKLGRYQELIEYHLSPEIQELTSQIREGNREMEDLGILNMLNTKFIKFGGTPQQVIQNSSINGNAWFVQTVKKVNSADEEINALGSIDTKETAVIDVSKFGEISDVDPNNSESSIELTARDLNEISYQYTSESGGLIVFSEIYYPKGWIATIDGQETDILCANYVLRALQVPAGKHEIKFEFKPRIYALGNRISLVFGILLYGSVLFLSAQPLLAKKVSTQ